MAAAGGNWAQYHDYANQSVSSPEVRQDLSKDPEAMRKLQLINDGLAQNLSHQKTLFSVIIYVVIGSLLAIILVNGCAAMWGTHLQSSVLISFNASIAVQSFLLLGVIARSLFPANTSKIEEYAEDR